MFLDFLQKNNGFCLKFQPSLLNGQPSIQSDLIFDVLPPLVVVFVQFRICIWFPRHMYNDMVLLSTVAFVAIEQ